MKLIRGKFFVEKLAGFAANQNLVVLTDLVIQVFDFYLGQALQADFLGRPFREINDAIVFEGAAIIDDNIDMTPVVQIGDANFCG